MIFHDPELNGKTLDPKRIGLPTASAASKLVTSKGEVSKSLEPYAFGLAEAIYANQNGKSLEKWSGNKYTELGHEREPMAKAWYEFESDYNTTVPGFITTDDMAYGCTPDLLVFDSDEAELGKPYCGIAQIKNCDVQHGKYQRYVVKNGTCPTEHYSQLQFEILVTEAIWNDIIYYHPVLEPFILRVDRNDAFISSLRKAIKTCIDMRDDYLKQMELNGTKLTNIYRKRLLETNENTNKDAA